MEIKLTIQEIRTILAGCEKTLRLVGSTEEYRRLQSSEYFSIANDVVIGDAISVVSDIVEAIDNFENLQQDSDGAGNN